MGSNPTVSAQLVPTLSTAHTRGEEGPNRSIAPGFHRTEVGLSTYPGGAQPSTGLGSKCGGAPRKWVDGPMEIVATARERLVLARDHGCAGTREVVRSEGLTRIGRGMYLRVESTWEPWERARVVNAARTIAALDGREGSVPAWSPPSSSGTSPCGRFRRPWMCWCRGRGGGCRCSFPQSSAGRTRRR